MRHLASADGARGSRPHRDLVAAVLAAAGLPAVSVLALVVEAVSLGLRLLVRLRRDRAVAVRPAQA
ncbi:hypothetical protein ACFWXZ_28390 [[Kitasatospora] papulosa]|uniref:hypothetical protein n=1 Tax=[Kitasatospora] papulosa TaxID=1464011 RepID=UPI003673F6B5